MNMEVNLDADSEALYRAAVGPKKADFYAPKFMRFDQPGSSKISWNWPALFVSFYWFLYRRMYGYWAIYCLLIPIVLVVLGGICGAVLGREIGNAVYVIAILGYRYVIIPIYANSLYHRTVKAQIEKIQRKVADRGTQIAVLENGPHTSHVIWIIVPFMMIAVIGILAAIAIPAYQNYTIRAQVAEGIVLSDQLKFAVAQRYNTNKAWPLDLTELGIAQSPSGNFVAAVGVDRGTVTVTYGNKANNLIAKHVLSMRPQIVGSDIVWICGHSAAAADDPTGPSAGPNITDLSANYLPAACRSSAR
jgi:Tfp pilus assembly major pilin PilA